MTSDPQLESLRVWIDETETAYCHAFAAGDWQKTNHYKKQLGHLRQQYGTALRRKLQQQEKERQQRSA